MKVPTRLLAPSGLVVAAFAAIIGASVAQADLLDPSDVPGGQVGTVAGKPSPDEPVETRIKQAIEEVQQEGQAALEELGELDSSDKVARAEQILKHMERATHEVRKRAHNRASERLDELNDLAVARLHLEARADLQELGEPGTAEERQRAEEIRARVTRQRERLEARWDQRREQLEQRHQERDLPEFDFRRPQGQPPDHAVACGLRAKVEGWQEDNVEIAIAQLEREAQTSLEELGNLDTPGKLERARKIRAMLKERAQELQDRAASQVKDPFDTQLEQQKQKLRLRAEAAIKELGELDTPEKQQRAEALQAKIDEQIRQLEERLGNSVRTGYSPQFQQQAEELRRQAQAAIEELGRSDSPEKEELARQIHARLEEQLLALREQVGDPARLALEAQVDRETQALRRRARAALDELGPLDTPEKVEAARRIQARLEEQVKDVTRHLARRAHSSFEEGFEEETAGLCRRADAALRELGQLDSLEKIERARQIRASMERDFNHLQRQQAARLRESLDQRLDLRAELQLGQARDAVTDHMRDSLRAGAQDPQARPSSEVRDRAVDALREHREHRDNLNDRAGDLRDRLEDRAGQVIRQNAGPEHVRTPTATRPATATPTPTREPERESTTAGEDSSEVTGDSGSRP